MKFENIQVGDDVLVPAVVTGYQGAWRGGWSEFHVLAQVTRVTKTQFTAGGERYMKEQGSQIGDYFRCAYPVGEEDRRGDVKYDQTEEVNAFKGEVAAIKVAAEQAEALLTAVRSSGHAEALALVRKPFLLELADLLEKHKAALSYDRWDEGIAIKADGVEVFEDFLDDEPWKALRDAETPP